jgi:hypothetical protein
MGAAAPPRDLRVPGKRYEDDAILRRPPELPNGPAKPGFDISRFALTAVGTFETFYVKETYPLKKVMDEGKVAPDTRLLVMETAAGRLAMITDQMTYHHIAQGQAHNKDWMATF